jgi:hypothetical protein
MMSAHILTVQDAGDAWKGTVIPKLQVRGKWLKEAGFEPGDKVQVVVYAPGILTIQSTIDRNCSK